MTTSSRRLAFLGVPPRVAERVRDRIVAEEERAPAEVDRRGGLGVHGACGTCGDRRIPKVSRSVGVWNPGVVGMPSVGLSGRRVLEWILNRGGPAGGDARGRV